MFKVVDSRPRGKLRRHRFILTVPGLTPISLVRGLRTWWVTDIVEWRPILQLGNLRVVSPEVEQMEVFVLSIITQSMLSLFSLSSKLVMNILALREVALPLTVTILIRHPSTKLETTPPVRLTCPNRGIGNIIVALSIPLAGLTMVAP